jgi:hypothetical protein
MTSPYKEDAAPKSTSVSVGGGRRGGGFDNASIPNYHIDQNTFNTNWNWSSTTKVTQTVDQFAGLCLKCHPKTSIDPGTSNTWRSMDRIHNTVKGWGGYGANSGNKIHAYTCSKCHAPHNSALNRLLVTNCLDYTHRGQVANGGYPASSSGNNDRGRGQGSFPAGGGGDGDSEGSRGWGGSSGGSSGQIGFGDRSCHDNTNSDGWPQNQRWNTVSPWGTPGSRSSDGSSGSGGGWGRY